MAEESFLSYEQIIAELKSLCAEKYSGTMSITTSENHSAWFVIHEGNIVSLAFRLKRGMAALPFIKNIKAGRFSLASELLKREEEPLLSTNEMLAILSSDIGSTRTVTLPQATTTRPPVTQAARSINVVLLDKVQRVIETELTEFLGPMASMIAGEYIQNVTNMSVQGDVVSLIEAIAKEIGDPVKAKDFKQRALSKLS